MDSLTLKESDYIYSNGGVGKYGGQIFLKSPNNSILLLC